jgi:hypothetical protein
MIIAMRAPLTIDDVIRRLDLVVDDASARGSRRGYFAALYRKVTNRVKRAIEEGDFEDGARMERLLTRLAEKLSLD